MRLNIISATPQHSVSELDVADDATVATLQQRILARLRERGSLHDGDNNNGTPQQTTLRLIHAGQLMRNDTPLSDYHLTDGDTVHMVLRTRAGGDATATTATAAGHHTHSSSSSSSSHTTTTSGGPHFTFSSDGGNDAAMAAMQRMMSMGVPIINVSATAGEAAVTPDGGIDIGAIMRMAAPMVQNVLSSIGNNSNSNNTTHTPQPPQTQQQPPQPQQQPAATHATTNTTTTARAAADAAAAAPRPFVATATATATPPPPPAAPAATTTTTTAAHAGDAAAQAPLPPIADIHVHVHCTVAELEHLPEQLRRLSQRTHATTTMPPIVTHTHTVAPPQQPSHDTPPQRRPRSGELPEKLNSMLVVMRMLLARGWFVLAALRGKVRAFAPAASFGKRDDATVAERCRPQLDRVMAYARAALDDADVRAQLDARARMPADEVRREATQLVERALTALLPEVLDNGADDAAWAERVGLLVLRWTGMLASRAARWFARGVDDLADVLVVAAARWAGDVDDSSASSRLRDGGAGQVAAVLRQLADAYAQHHRRDSDENDVFARRGRASDGDDDDELEQIANELLH